MITASVMKGLIITLEESFVSLLLGNELFPPFGLCDIYASSSDKKSSFGDEHTVLCEMSQHILFQYTFMVIWFAIVIGIGVSAIGVIMQIALYVIGVGIR